MLLIPKKYQVDIFQGRLGNFKIISMLFLAYKLDMFLPTPAFNETEQLTL